MTTPEQHISEIRNVKLTDAERIALRNKLHAYSLSYIPARSIPAKLWQWAGHHSALALGLAIFLIAGGTGVSAHWASPGDVLYGFRLGVNDRVETALAFNDDAQINIEMRHMQRMMDDEDAVRDEELSEIAFADFTDDEDVFEDEPDDTLRPTVSQTLDVHDDNDAPEALDGGSFERELRGIELELQAEERVGLELE